jgi:hypothetical protein
MGQQKKGSELPPFLATTECPFWFQTGLDSRLQSPSAISNGIRGKTGLSPAASTLLLIVAFCVGTAQLYVAAGCRFLSIAPHKKLSTLEFEVHC